MKRLLATSHCDLRLQWRNGFYYAMAFVVAVWALLSGRLATLDLAPLLPALVAGNLLLVTFYFVGGLVLLEKAEGTLEAQVVTPLRAGEYLAAKVLTLTLLALIENVVLVGLLYRRWFSPVPLVVGIALASALFVLAGIVAVARYASINEYLLPSILFSSAVSAPLLPALAQWQHPALLLHPLQATLVTLRAAFEPVAGWQLVYGLLYSALWIAVGYRWSKRALRRYMVGAAGEE